MKNFIYTLLLLAMPFITTAQETKTTEYSKALGDSAYSHARYDDAIRIYETVIANEGGSVELYYNLGNAFYRSNMIGKAILNYERALRIDPTDKDTKANLEHANFMTKDEIAEQYELFLTAWFKSVVNAMGITAWAVVAIISFILLLSGLLLFFFNRKAGIRKTALAIALISFFVAIFANIAAAHIYNYMNDDSEAIVMKEEAYLKSTPDNSGTELIKIHEGRKVRIIDDTMREWKEVELEEGTVGWLPSTAIERI